MEKKHSEAKGKERKREGCEKEGKENKEKYAKGKEWGRIEKERARK